MQAVEGVRESPVYWDTRLRTPSIPSRYAVSHQRGLGRYFPKWSSPADLAIFTSGSAEVSKDVRGPGERSRKSGRFVTLVSQFV